MSKDLYRELCRTEESIPVFSRDWWLDIVCDEQWDVLIVRRKGRILSSLPLYIPASGVVTMPHYTQTMGVWFLPESDDTNYCSVLERRQSICRELIKKLDKYSAFYQNFSCDFTDWLPFYWAGFNQTTRYTYILENIKDTEYLLTNMDGQARRNIRNAVKNLIEVRSDVCIDEFLKVQSLTFERQNKRNKQSSEVLIRLIEESRKRKQGDIFGGYDKDGNLHAAAFVVWQKSSAYYIAGGGDPSFRSSGAHSLVLFEAIKYVSRFTDIFDFEGSMIPGVERFFREFGALQKQYFLIYRGRMSLLDRLKIKIRSR
jgi:hypothetical protein